MKVGDRVKVKVLQVDEARRRIALSIKALQAGAAAPQHHPPPQPRSEPFNAPRRR